MPTEAGVIDTVVTGSWMPDVGTGTQTWVPWKSTVPSFQLHGMYFSITVISKASISIVLSLL